MGKERCKTCALPPNRFWTTNKGTRQQHGLRFLAFNTKIEHVGCHANLFDRGNVQRNDQRGWMACKEMFSFCFRRYGGWYKRDPIASLPCQRWPFGLCMSHVGGKPWQDWQTQRTPRIGEFLFSMGWLKCQRFLIFRRFIVDHTCRSLKQMQKRRCIDSKTIKVGTVNVARVE